jgi:hypothetical protein
MGSRQESVQAVLLLLLLLLPLLLREASSVYCFLLLLVGLTGTPDRSTTSKIFCGRFVHGCKICSRALL